MTARERVARTLDLKTPDRIPLRNAITPIARLQHPGEVEAYLRESPDDFAGCGIKGLEINRTLPGEQTDRWGCVWRNDIPGLIGYVTKSPLDDWANKDTYPFPGPGDLYDFSGMEETIARNKATGYILGPGGWLWQRMFWVRGFENILLDIAEAREEVIWLRDRVLQVQKAVLEKVLARDVDGIEFLDDWGGQDSLLIRPEAWRELFKNAYRELFTLVHAAGKKVFFHTDGEVSDIVGDLVEIGADVLNIQVPIMDKELLAKLTRGKATLLGGLDLQGVLPKGDPKEVRDHLLDLLDRFSTPEGGYIGQVIWDDHLSPATARLMAETIRSYAAS